MSDGVGLNASLPTAMLTALTYRRVDRLETLIPELLEQARSASDVAQVRILIVDNDPAGSARPVVEAFVADGSILYENETTPGIAVARNRALDVAKDSDYLVFIDDDEVPSPGWLPSLITTQVTYGGAGAFGPVIARYAVEPDPFITAGQFFVRPRWDTGAKRYVGYSSNVLINMSRVLERGLRFDESLGMRGGEDTLFTTELARVGEPFRWDDNAVVFDLVPTERMTRKWVLQRRFGFGTVRSLVALSQEPTAARRVRRRCILVAQGGVRMVAGSARFTAGRVSGSIVNEALGLRTFSQGRGLLAGAFGRSHAEYEREG